MDTRQRWTLVLTAMASVMAGLDMLVVITAMNTIRLHLHASISELDWIVNSYTLATAVLLLTAAAIGDRIGRRRMLIIGLALFSASSAACALAPSLTVLVAARTVQGAASAILVPNALALVTAAFPPERRGKAMGLFSGTMGVSVLAGPVIGGAVTQGLAWQWIFWLNVPIGIVLIPLTARWVAESHGPRVRLDPGGLVLSGAGAFGLVWGLIKGNADGWGSLPVVVPLVAGALAIAAFVAWELRTRSPMVPMRLFRAPAFGASNAAGFLMTAGTFGGAFFVAQYLQAGMGDGPLSAGLRMLPFTATLFVVAPVAGTVVHKTGERLLAVGGLLGQGAGYAWLGVVSGHGYPAMIPGMIVAGAGVSAAMPAVQTAVVGAVPREAIGTASGVYNALRQLGGTFGIAVMSAVFASAGGFTGPEPVAHGFRAALFVAAAGGALGALAAVWLRPAHAPAAAVAADPVPVDARAQ